MALTSFQRKDHLDDNFPVQGSPTKAMEKEPLKVRLKVPFKKMIRQFFLLKQCNHSLKSLQDSSLEKLI